MDRIVAARQRLMEEARRSGSADIAFYDPAELNVRAPLRDNLLFGRIGYGVAGAEQKVLAAVRDSIKALALEPQVYRLGLDFQVGNGGRRLSPAQRAGVSIARTLVKRPSLFVLDNALVAFGEGERRAIRQTIRSIMVGRTLVEIAQDESRPDEFDWIVRFTGAKVSSVEGGAKSALATEDDADNSVTQMRRVTTAAADPAPAAE